MQLFQLNLHMFFQHKIENIFLPISFYICFGCSKEPSQRDGSFEYKQHMFRLRNKKINFWYGLLIKVIWFSYLNQSESIFLVLIEPAFLNSFLANWWLLSSADHLWKQFRPNTLGLIWLQTVWHSDGILKRIFLRYQILKKKVSEQTTKQHGKSTRAVSFK